MQALVAAGGVAADHADGLQLVHHLGHRHQLAHRAERLAPEVGVGAGQDHAHAAAREQGRHRHDVRIEELRLVDRDDLGVGAHQPEDLGGGIHRRGLELGAVVAGDAVEAGIAAVEMGLEDLHPPPGDDRRAGRGG